MSPLRFVIAGSGWRALFYVRIARRYPEQFQLCHMLCRTQEKADRMKKEQGIPATASREVCMADRPDFVVVAVSKNSMHQAAAEWLEKGFAVLMETPAGLTVPQLEGLWELRQRGARIQVAEQYCRYPSMAAGLDAIERGLLGEPYAAALSVAHDYHGASLIRHMLYGKKCPDSWKNGDRGMPAMKLYGEKYVFPVTETDSRYGAVTDGSVRERERDRVTIRFCDGKAAFYDFSGVQYHSFIRARHVNVQGQNGEWNDTVVRYVGEGFRPALAHLKPLLKAEYRALETEELQTLAAKWSPHLAMEDLQDEYAIATMMLDMRAYLKTGRECYPLAEALEDAYTWILMQEALKNPGREIASEKMPWHTG